MKNKFKFILVVFLLLFGLFACDTGENNKDDKENNDDVNINIPTEYKGYYKEIVAALNNDTNNKVVSSKVEMM